MIYIINIPRSELIFGRKAVLHAPANYTESTTIINLDVVRDFVDQKYSSLTRYSTPGKFEREFKSYIKSNKKLPKGVSIPYTAFQVSFTEDDLPDGEVKYSAKYDPAIFISSMDDSELVEYTKRSDGHIEGITSCDWMDIPYTLHRQVLGIKVERPYIYLHDVSISEEFKANLVKLAELAGFRFDEPDDSGFRYTVAGNSAYTLFLIRCLKGTPVDCKGRVIDYQSIQARIVGGSEPLDVRYTTLPSDFNDGFAIPEFEIKKSMLPKIMTIGGVIAFLCCVVIALHELKLLAGIGPKLYELMPDSIKPYFEGLLRFNKYSFVKSKVIDAYSTSTLYTLEELLPYRKYDWYLDELDAISLKVDKPIGGVVAHVVSRNGVNYYLKALYDQIDNGRDVQFIAESINGTGIVRAVAVKDD